MALTATQFQYFQDRMDVMDPDLTSVKTAVEALVVDVAALEVLVAATNTKLDSLITLQTSTDAGISTLDASIATLDVDIVTALGSVSLGNGVLSEIRDELVGVRNTQLE